jgi:UDP-N-acetylglucosamine--N-acetylmuramyl-(pentapeptide) pyrophosphoryl-undecaprenol N-acetylglucosamine transferase
MEARIVGSAKLQFAPILAGKFRRGRRISNLALNLKDLLLVLMGFIQAIRILRRFKPDVVFLKGGFVCLPVGFATKLLRIPFVIHESDIHPGLTNRILGRWADVIAVGFPVKNYHNFPVERLVFTGSPVRQELLSAHRLEGIAAFRLEATVPVILVTGGSQGAQQINNVILESLPELLNSYQVIHITGDGEFDRVKFELSRQSKLAHADRYHPIAFLLKEMPAAMAAADLLIARAGAQTIAEAAVLGKATVLIPNYQSAAHQLENAKVLSRAGAARVLDGSKLTSSKLVGEVRRLLDDPIELERLSRGIQAYGSLSAASDLAEVILVTGRDEVKHG